MKMSNLLASGWRGTSQTPLSDLDIALAHLLQNLQPSTDERHLWLAALASHQWGRGHACLDLNQWPDNAGFLLAWSPQALAALPAKLALGLSDIPWAQGEHSPLVVQDKRLYLRRAWAAEQDIRARLFSLQQSRAAPPDLTQQLDHLFGTDQSDGQRLACAHAAQNALTLITGGPGTGKTTTVVKLLRLLQSGAATPLRTLLAAPTGKAAARLAQAMVQARATLSDSDAACLPNTAHTLHKLLYTSRGNAPVLQANVIVVDEASMIDLELMARLLKAVPDQARLVLLGDKDQLASVEAGAVMSQLCQAPWLQAHTMVLTHSHRFDPDQGIGAWAKACNTGDSAGLQALWQTAPQACWSKVASVTKLSSANSNSADTLQALALAWAPWRKLLAPHQQGQGCDDTQALALLQSFGSIGVLCGLREGPWGVKHFNQQKQQAMGFANTDWFVGRPVMARRNDYALGLMNGDLGMCLPVLVDGDIRLRVAFPDGQGGVCWLVPSRLQAIDTVFAMTVHQSQGSEFEHVLLILPEIDTPLLKRELVYTGITRARSSLCVWAPSPPLLMHAITQGVVRSGGLSEPLR
jgi:exodeoxyribonuclease V alpha subunit